MNIQQIVEFFDNDRFAKMTGAVVEEITDDEVVCSLALGGNHRNAGGTVQGGAIFTLADFAFAIACNLDDLKADVAAISVSQSSTILFFRPATGSRLVARATCLQKGRKLSVYRMVVTDDTGVCVAEMTGNAYRVVKQLLQTQPGTRPI